MTALPDDVQPQPLGIDQEMQVLLSGSAKQQSRPRWRIVAGIAATIGIGALAWPGSHGLLRASAAEAVEEFALKPCLCVFDIDRTLTAKQGWASKCPKATEVPGAQDIAYAGGTLIFSDLKTNLQSTFCGKCYSGIVTAGTGSGDGSEERKGILEALGGTKKTRTDWWQGVNWNWNAKVRSSLVVQAPDTKKQNMVLSMLDWWREDQKIDFDKSNVYFFDDIAGNVQPFEGTGLNARQISCESRGPKENLPGSFDGKLGGCGGTAAELTDEKGIKVC